MIKKYLPEIQLIIAFAIFIINQISISLSQRYKFSLTNETIFGFFILLYIGYASVIYVEKRNNKKIKGFYSFQVAAIGALLAISLAFLITKLYNNFYEITTFPDFSIWLYTVPLSGFIGILGTTAIGRRYSPWIILVLVLGNSLLSRIISF